VITAKTQNGATKTTSDIDDKNRLKQQFISSHAFYQTPDGHVQKITTEE
jgi:hypothetical protein